MISFKNRNELIDFVKRCADSEYSPEEVVDSLIHEMQEAGEITPYSLLAEKNLKAADNAAQSLGESEATGMIAALAGIGFALMNNGQNAEMFYASMIAAEEGP